MNIFQRAWDHISGNKAKREAEEYAAMLERIKQEDAARAAERQARREERERKVAEANKRFQETRRREEQIRAVQGTSADADYAVYLLWMEYYNALDNVGDLDYMKACVVADSVDNESIRAKRLAERAGISDDPFFVDVLNTLERTETRQSVESTSHVHVDVETRRAADVSDYSASSSYDDSSSSSYSSGSSSSYSSSSGSSSSSFD